MNFISTGRERSHTQRIHASEGDRRLVITFRSAIPTFARQVALVSGKCANNSCPARHTAREGKLFRLDLDIGNTAGEIQHETTYIWLCSRCAARMIPKVSVTGNTVFVRLGLTPQALGRAAAWSPRVN